MPAGMAARSLLRFAESGLAFPGIRFKESRSAGNRHLFDPGGGWKEGGGWGEGVLL